MELRSRHCAILFGSTVELCKKVGEARTSHSDSFICNILRLIHIAVVQCLIFDDSFVDYFCVSETFFRPTLWGELLVADLTPIIKVLGIGALWIKDANFLFIRSTIVIERITQLNPLVFIQWKTQRPVELIASCVPYGM